MSVTAPPLEDTVIYPDSDGQPMAENTLQYEWIVRIKGNLDAVFRDRPDVFVAGDNLIYPVKGRNDIRAAPDVYVAFDRPKGHRGSFQVWKEGGAFPQVVFEVLSPGNRAGEMADKFEFYRKHGAEEYYIYDPDTNEVKGYVRQGERLVAVPRMHNFTSPRLGVRFDTSGPELALYRPDGTRFFTFDEVDRARITSHLLAASVNERLEAERERSEEERRRADEEKQRADEEKQRAEAEKQRADEAVSRAALLAAKLRELGIDPTTLGNTQT